MEQRQFQRLLGRMLALPVIVLAVLTATLLWLNSRQSASLRMVDHSDEVIGKARHLSRLAVDQETGLRGYLLTGDPMFLDPYDKARAQMEPSFEHLRRLVFDNPTQLQRTQQLRATYEEWQRFSDSMITARQSVTDVRSAAMNVRGKEIMDRIREQTTSLVDEEDRLRSRRVAAARRDGRTVWIVAIVLAGFFAFVLVFLTRRHMIAISRSYLHALADARFRAAALAETRRELDAVLASMADGLYQLDTEGRLVYLNPAGERMLGYRVEEISGKNMHDVVHSRTPEGEHRTWQDCPLLSVVQKGVPYHADEDHLVRKDGSFLPVEATSSPIVINGKVAGAVLTFRDLTERKRSQQALHASDRLATAGRLATAIAHEINNPLDSIGNILYVLQERPLDRESRGLMDNARDELARITQITRNMLALQREAQAPVPVKMTEILDGLLSLYERKLHMSKIHVERRYEDEGEVRAFPGEMRQVFSNLIGNALEAIGNRGGRILLHVSSGRDWKHAGRTGVRVVVADDGPGIPAALRKRIFEPFFTTKAESGTGLGLWVSYGIVQKHEGMMRIYSSTAPRHRGTVFSVFLPHTMLTAEEQEAKQRFPASA